VIFVLIGCAPSGGLTKSETGAVAGGVVGAPIVAAIGSASVNAGTGGAIGYALETQEQDLRNMGYETSHNGNRLTAYFPNDALFAAGSAELLPGALAELSRVAGIINDDPSTSVIVEGHTDSDGTLEYNQILSELRANAVRTALVSCGVDPRRIAAYGYGEDRPPVSNGTPYNRQRNRRLEVTILSPAH
jgi:outer membrane protein OmpA-like peptidoglycan-associated protein